jgi:hypothetical protein
MGVFELGADSVFDVKESETFIAEANDSFSGYYEKEHFNHDWAYRNYPAGRYVIIVYQIHSLYQDGKQIWINRHFINEVGRFSRYRTPCFVIISDQVRDYMIPSWGRRLSTHTIQNDKAPLQAGIHTLEEAKQFAIAHSVDGRRTAVMEWYEDYNMF